MGEIYYRRQYGRNILQETIWEKYITGDNMGEIYYNRRQYGRNILQQETIWEKYITTGDNMGDQTQIIQKVKLSDGTIINVEARLIGEARVALEALPFKEVGVIVEGISKEIADMIQKIKYDKMSVTFGLELGVETKGLTALLVSGSSKANLEVTLEWEGEACPKKNYENYVNV